MISEVMRCLRNKQVLMIVDFNRISSSFGSRLRIEHIWIVGLYSQIELVQKNVFDIYYQIDLKDHKNVKR